MMKRKRISVIFGTRPEAIKLAPVILGLRKEEWCECRVCVTGQHRQMLDQVLEAFEIKPDADLALMRPDQTLAGLTSRAMDALDKYLAAEKPDLVLVQGDTTTVFCAALAAFYRHIPVGHVEAGLRTWNLQAPWPEEANRVLTSRLAALHFAPTESARLNLVREGVLPESIHVTGNTVIDALFLALEKIRKHPPAIPGLPGNNMDSLLDAQVVLITGHRRENFGDGFDAICRAIAELARRFPAVHFVYPVHLNPNVREPAQRILGQHSNTPEVGKRALGVRNVHLIEPLAYTPFVALMNRATLILTDSGGIQEESPSLGKPVLVMRDTTERPEAVAAGAVKLVGANKANIVREVSGLLSTASAREAMSHVMNPYGDGKSTFRVTEVCRSFLRLL